jgi:hypothetical protein
MWRISNFIFHRRPFMKTHSFLAACILAVASICLFAASSNAHGDSPHEVLGHWIGTWTGGVAGGESGTDGFIGKPNKAVAEWALDEKFVQGTNSDSSGKPVGIWMLGHNAKAGKYEVWYFTANSGVLHWYGSWSGDDHTMTWTGDDSPGGAKLSGFTRFDGDKQNWELKFEQDGRVTTDTGALEKQ